MNQWDERIREHRVWTDMKNLGPAIDKVIAGKGIQTETLLGSERLRTILAYLGKRIAAADPIITSPSLLDSIASFLTSIQSELDAFVLDEDATHILNANTSADGLLIAASQLAGAYSPEELGVLIASVADYRKITSDALKDAQKRLGQFSTQSDESTAALSKQLEEHFSTLTARTEAVQTSLNAVAAGVEVERQKIAAIVSEQQGQFSTSQDTRSKEFTESLRLANEGFTKLVSDYQSQFSSAQDTRGKEHTAAESLRQTKFNELVADFGKKLTEQDAEFTKARTAFVLASEQNLANLVTEYDEKAAKVLADVEENLKRVENLVGVIGNLGVTSGYLRTANQARYRMWAWQAATLLALITLSTLAYRTLGLLEDHGGHFSWGGFAGRALLLVSLGVIAAYSGSQADKLFTDERRNRKLALELEAIGPYLAPLPVEEQNKFRLQIGDRSFGRDPDPHQHRKSPASALDLFKSKESQELLSLLIEAATKARGVK